MSDPTNVPDPTDIPDDPPNDPPPQETSTPRPPPPPPTDEPEPPPTSTPTSRPPPPPSPSNPPPDDTDPPPDDDTTQTIPPTGGQTSTVIEIITRSGAAPPPGTDPTGLPSDSPQESDDASGGGGLSNSGKIAIAVVVPVVAVALFLVAAIWFWRRRKARKDAEEERRKEVEDYAYNPNADPTIPAVGLVNDGPYEMREDGTSGYRGWGSTVTPVGSTGQKASTTMSGGGFAGAAYSDSSPQAQQQYGNVSDTGRSGEPLVEGGGSPRDGSYSPDGEILGAMGPSAAANRGGGDIRRGPSNASSSYSAGARSDGSDGMAGAYPGQYYDQYGAGNPYANVDQYGGGQGRPGELPGQPVIRDNPARRNTRIESPSHYPQQSAGISQNF